MNMWHATHADNEGDKRMKKLSLQWTMNTITLFIILISERKDNQAEAWTPKYVVSNLGNIYQLLFLTLLLPITQISFPKSILLSWHVYCSWKCKCEVTNTTRWLLYILVKSQNRERKVKNLHYSSKKHACDDDRIMKERHSSRDKLHICMPVVKVVAIIMITMIIPLIKVMAIIHIIIIMTGERWWHSL